MSAPDTRHPHDIAMECCRKDDEFSVIRRRLDIHIDRVGGQVWMERWLVIRDIEDFIDAKIAASRSKPPVSAS